MKKNANLHILDIHTEVQRQICSRDNNLSSAKLAKERNPKMFHLNLESRDETKFLFLFSQRFKKSLIFAWHCSSSRTVENIFENKSPKNAQT
jgi:hypothetical protein